MTELEIVKAYIEQAIEILGWTDVKVFDYESDDDCGRDFLCPSYSGLRVSECPNVGEDYEILILPREGEVEQEGLTGKYKIPATFFDIIMPVYDAGDMSVGIQGGWMTDPEDEPSYSFRSAHDVARKIAMLMLDEQLETRLQNFGEYLWFKEQQGVQDGED